MEEVMMVVMVEELLVEVVLMGVVVALRL